MRSSQVSQASGTRSKASSSEQEKGRQSLVGLTIAACLILLIYIFSASGWSQLFVPLSNLLRISMSRIRLLYLIWGIGYLPGTLVGGVMLDRYGPRSVFFGAALLVSSGLLLFVLCLLLPQIAPFLLFLIFIGVAGMGGGLIEASTNGLISSVYADRRGMMLNLFNALYPFGAMLMALIDAGLLAIFHNNPFPALLFTLVFSGAAMFSLFGVPKNYHLKNCPSTLKGTLENFPSLLPVLAPVMIVMMLTSGINTSLHTWAPTYLQVAFHESAGITAVLSAIVWAAAVGSRLGAAWLITCIGSWKMVMLSIGVALLGLLLLLLSPNSIVATVGIAITGLGLAPTFSTLLTIGGERTERTPGSVTGLLLFSSGLCTLACSWLFGFLLGVLGAFWPILFCLVFVLLGVFVALYLRPKYTKKS